MEKKRKKNGVLGFLAENLRISADISIHAKIMSRNNRYFGDILGGTIPKLIPPKYRHDID